MAGDPDAARHLGYYAELRATMSILAGDGIGVFQNKHIIVTKKTEMYFVEKLWRHSHICLGSHSKLGQNHKKDMIHFFKL